MELSDEPTGATSVHDSVDAAPDTTVREAVAASEQAASGLDELGHADPELLRSLLFDFARENKVPALLTDIGSVEANGDRVANAGHLFRSALILDPDHQEAREQLDALPDMPGPSATSPAESANIPGPAAPQAKPAKLETFSGHYHDWRQKRVTAIFDRYGPAWFHGARVLEIGCGYGDIGSYFRAVGADVTFSEGRDEHLDVIADRYPGLHADRLVQYDAEDPWPFGRYDLVINMGLVYHVDNWERSIIGATRSADRIVLETEVCDSDDPNLVVKTKEAGPDQAVSGTGSRPSAAAVEAVLRAEGFRFDRLADNRCNSGFHRYDWPVANTGTWEHGLRRFWFAWREGAPLPH